jgi:subtilisin
MAAALARAGVMGVSGVSGPPPARFAPEVGKVGATRSAALAIPEIGVLAVGREADGPDQGRVQEILSTIEPRVVVEPGVVCTTSQDALLPSSPPATPPYLPVALAAADGQVMWFEAALEAGEAGEVVPWGVTRVKAPTAWSLPAGATGLGVRVAVVDTGCGPHIDLPTPMASATFVPGTNSANDDHEHGTHVAGTILARRNARGVVGVAPGASLMRVKCLDRTGDGEDSWVAAGVVWAVNNGAQIINLSLGSPTPSPVIDRALAFARAHGVLICAAAGNNYGAGVEHPAQSPLTIAVTAVDDDNRAAAFNAVGPEVDLAAPGVDILSTVPANAFWTMSGTSMAAPHVAGVAALLLGEFPGATPGELQDRLERSATPLGAQRQFGRGLVQADRALAGQLGGQPQEPGGRDGWLPSFS